MTILVNSGEDMEAFWALDQYSVFSVQARYEEGDVALDEPLNRDVVIAEVRTLLEKVDALFAQFAATGEGA
ncbi:MAG: hypothetical protein KKG92_03750 [Gammaproteobacteria bacterium]|nr:hypothetical protein [Gammaproteobacteria bacterium]